MATLEELQEMLGNAQAAGNQAAVQAVANKIAEIQQGPSIGQLEQALRNADAAGDSQAASILASEISKIQAKAAKEPVASGSLLPFSRTAGGTLEFDSDAGISGAVKRAVTLPSDAMTGKVQVMDPDTGRPTDEAIGRSMEMAATTSPINPAVRAGSKLVAGSALNARMKKPPVPTAKELLKAGGKDYDAMRATGAQYGSQDVKAMAESMMIKLNEKGFDETTAPDTFRTLFKLANPPEGSFATIGGLHSARKTLGKTGQNFNNPADQGAASQAIKELEGFISGAGRVASQSGGQQGANAASQQSAAALLKRGNRNYSAGKRSDLTQGIERSANLRAAAANSGQNTGNAIRSRVATALLKDKDTAGFSNAEKELLEGIVVGSKGANRARDIGNRLGGGGGLGSAWVGGLGGGAGYAMGSELGVPGMGAAVGAALPMLLGGSLKGMSNRMTQKALQQADEVIRMRSPLYKQRTRGAPTEVLRDKKAEALIRALMMTQQSPDFGVQ